MKKLVIIGAGGMGRETAWTIERINGIAPAWEIVGFADDAPSLQNGSVDGLPLLGSVEKAAQDHPDAAFFIAVGDNGVRERIYNKLPGREFPVIADPSADIAPTAELRQGVLVGPHAVVSAGAKLGMFALVNARAGVGHDCVLGDFSQVCPGATLSGGTVLGDHAFVGSNACTAPGVKVGAHAKIAAGTPAYGNVGDGDTLSPFGTLKAQLGG
jgi:sugar O-acyltransferase (sialic acid O-acetyltransferase NeuD family)